MTGIGSKVGRQGLNDHEGSVETRKTENSSAVANTGGHSRKDAKQLNLSYINESLLKKKYTR